MDRKTTEEDLVRSAREWQHLFDVINSVIWILDPDHIILRSNKTAEKVFQRSRREMLGRHCWEIVHGTTAPIPGCPILRTRESLSRESMELQVGANWFEVTTDPLLDESGRYCGAIHIVNEITVRKHMEEALHQRESYLSAIIENLPGLVWLKDLECRFLAVNQAFAASCEKYNAEELIGKTDLDIWPADLAKKYRRDDFDIMKTGKTATIEEPIVDKGVTRWFETHKTPVCNREGIIIGTTGYAHDITDRKKAEEERNAFQERLQQLHKAASLNRMAGAISHHFNNQLQAVMGNLELAMEDLPRDGNTAANLTQAMQAAQKAASICSSLLTYLGQTTSTQEALDLSDVCSRSLPVIQVAIPKNIALETDFPVPGPVIYANANNIRQILSNLITNSWEAIGNNPGSIHLAVNVTPAADIPALNRFPIDWQPQDQPYVFLEVMDNGCGIAPKDIPYLFDPFFSSKFTGRGLGLPVTLGIVRTHNGAVAVDSEIGRGSIFRIYFPMSGEKINKPFRPKSTIPECKGDGTVLLVEDEEVQRQLTTNMLVRLGFTVLIAKDGVDAIEIFRRNRHRIRFVISDLVMPNMNGWETMAALSKLSPDIKVILASGCDEDFVMKNARLGQDFQVFLQKPFVFADLTAAVQQLLEQE
ncbi:MAG: PAS domain-containing protein [Thermodesulfobacteriota bacterium]